MLWRGLGFIDGSRGKKPEIHRADDVAKPLRNLQDHAKNGCVMEHKFRAYLFHIPSGGDRGEVFPAEAAVPPLSFRAQCSFRLILPLRSSINLESLGALL